MAEYWFVVPPADDGMFEALSSVLKSRPGFYIIKDRRASRRPEPWSGGMDRRTAHVWGCDVLQIAEREPDAPQ